MAALALGIILSGCSEGDPKAKEKGATDSNKTQLFTVPKEQLSHIQVVTVQPTSWPRVLRLNGTVAYNGFLTTPVISQVSGPVSRILVSPGQQVKKGQPMLYVSSPDYSQLRANYLKARDAHSLAHKNYLRSQDLFAHHAIAERDLQAAESAEIQAQADQQAAEQSLKILGIPRPDTLIENPTSPEVPVLAPIMATPLNVWWRQGRCCKRVKRSASPSPTWVPFGCWPTFMKINSLMFMWVIR